jgi:protein O-GlcNAc transferase
LEINNCFWEVNRCLKICLLQGHHPEGGAHAKFTNYAFDVDEFLRLVAVGAKHVKHHTAFQEFHVAHHDEL